MDEQVGRTSDTRTAPSPELLTAREVAARAGVNERTIRRAIARGELPAFKQGGTYRIEAADADHFRRRGAGAPRLGRRLLALVPPNVSPFRAPLQFVPPLPRLAPLPEPLTSFLGREELVAAIQGRLARDEVRLLVLTGPGGVGKTRVALAVAAGLREAFADGVCFVALSSVADPALLTSAVARAVGIQEANGRSLSDHLKSLLGDRRLLLVLDNFEQVAAGAPFVGDLIEACPGLTVLVTSRTLLRISGEQAFPVTPFAVAPTATPLAADRLAQSAAVQLFVERAQSVVPDFALTPDLAPVVVAICRHLDGLPLAIELAAARVRHLPLPALLARLERGGSVLTGGPTTGPARQRTMRDALAWSYGLLRPAEQSLFRRLAVFAGGWTLAAAEAVAGRPEADDTDVLDGISSLLDQSLLHRVELGDDEPRFDMLETIRELGREKLSESGEEEAVGRRHVAWALALAERAEPELYGGEEQARWLRRLDIEHDNLRLALTQAGTPELEARLAGALYWFWYLRGHFTEGRRRLERALERSADAPAGIRGRVMLGLGMLAQRQGDDAAAREYLANSLGLARAAGDSFGVTQTLGLMALTAEDDGHFQQAGELLKEALAVYRAAAMHERRALEALALAHLGVVAWGLGDAAGAAAHWEEALALHRTLSDSWGIANVRAYQALAACDRGEVAQAAALEAESLSLFWAAGSVEDIAVGLATAAAIAAASRDLVFAARLFGAADALLETIGGRFRPPESAVYELARNVVRAGLAERALTTATAAGRGLPVADAVAAAIAFLDRQSEPGAAPAPAATRAGLTPRELEVLRLLVAGRSDREIGDTLFISRRTAMTHVSNVLAKLGVASRGAAAVLAVREGLV